MDPRKLSLGIALALGLMACTRTELSAVRDAAVDGQPISDIAPGADLVVVPADIAPLVADAAVVVSDVSVVVSDVAVAGSDTSGLGPDAGVELRDSMVSVPDTAGPVSDVSVRVPDTAAPVPDTSAVRPEIAPSFFANRTFSLDPSHPAPTPDPACTQYESVDSYRLVFGEDGSTLNGLAVRGSAATKFHATLGPESDRITFHIDDLLGGGRVYLDLDHDVYVGEVIVYGSGVPIVRCLRGGLVPVP